MTLAEDVTLESVITGKDELSGADIKVLAFCVTIMTTFF
jgi:ATP-dependent 26S proteasome regulatory subunit